MARAQHEELASINHQAGTYAPVPTYDRARGELYRLSGIGLLETELSSQMSVKKVLFQRVPAETTNFANTMRDSIVQTGRLAFMRAR
jgi:hypothetical protein